ncbi:MAG: DUF1501 domain-containing protein, partial [Planctomycetota bacterium]
ASAALPMLFSRALFAAGASERILVLVQLEGGNDGLNTVVPFGDDLYYKARPSLGVKRGDTFELNEQIGLHPGLRPLRAAWDGGHLGVVQGVGYPEPNRSHFTSSDIWHTASTTPPERWNGWLGRALDRVASNDVPGLHLDPGPLNLALVGEKVVVPSIADAARFKVEGGRRDLLRSVSRRPRSADTAEFIRKSAAQAYDTSARVEKALQNANGRGAYPQTELANRLWQTARLIEAGMPSRVYAVRLSGFDTHSRQAEAHAALMAELGGALAAFQADLQASGSSDRVLTVTYSEFGRRVKQNRSLGTDHGAAAPMLVLGGKVRGGIHGAHPSLADLDDGDLKHHTDFRQVYATILDRWIGAPSQKVLRGSFSPVGIL